MTMGLMHLIRLPAFAALFCLLYRLLRNRKLARRRIFIPGLVIVTLTLGLLSSFYPPENLFLTFATPERALIYQEGQGTKPFQVVVGQHSALMCCGKIDDTKVEIIPKGDNGWKLPTGVRKVSFAGGIVEIEGLTVSTVAISGADDVYLQLVPMAHEKDIDLTLSHNRDTAFSMEQENQPVSRIYAACVGALEDYQLTINGHSFILGEKESLPVKFLTWQEVKNGN